MTVIFVTRLFRAVMVRAILFSSRIYDPVGPGSGIFSGLLETIKSIARDFWGVLVGLIIVGATIAMIVSVLKGTGGMLIGGTKETTVAIIGVVGVVLLVVISFVAIPELSKLITNLAPAAPF
jgi:hypothetical protein